MPGKNADKIKITLCGDWSMSGVTDQMPRLAEQLASLSALASETDRPTCAAEKRPEVVMTGIDEFDASGCQLLALFVRLLKGKGIMPLFTEVPEAIMEKILHLGFARELGAYFETTEETA